MSSVCESDVNLNDVTIDALNYSLRLKLSNMLNPELPFFESDGYARDYRGLAELMGFDHNTIINFQRQKNPTLEIMGSWSKNHTVSEFVDILQTLNRYDIIDDLMPHIISDSRGYLAAKQLQIQPLQVGEVSSCIDNVFPSENPDHLTIYDSTELTTFDAYVCYANSDIQFVRWLAEHLETSATGIKLCIRDRDLPYGTLEYESFVRLIQERCNRILVVLSPQFLVTPECEYQAKYAASLASEHRNRRVIPIVYKPCDIPPILKYISKVNFMRSDIQDWIWVKLVASIKTPTTKLFVPPDNFSNSSQVNFETMPYISEASSSGSDQMPALPDVPSSNVDLVEPSSSTTGSGERIALVEVTGGNKSRGPRIVQRFKNFMSSSTSSGSSGFHSQSDS